MFVPETSPQTNFQELSTGKSEKKQDCTKVVFCAMFLYKVIHRVIHRVFIKHNLICKVVMEIKVKTLCKLALQVNIKTKINGNKTKKNTLLYNVMYSIFFLYSPYKAFYFLLIYLYICFIKFADTIQKIRGLVQLGDTVQVCWIVDFLRYSRKKILFPFSGN